LALGAPTGCSAQDDPTDLFIGAEMERQNIPGLSLVVLQDGRVLKVGGYGLADRGSGERATPETAYKIASVSKQFIAAGIMVLVQDGLVGLDDPVNRFLSGAPRAWDHITVRHLLTHTAGLVREGPGFDPSVVQTDAEVIASAYSVDLLSAPGDEYEYSNLGYFVLAEIISVASGRPWTEFIRERIFEPAGMHSTRTTTLDPGPDQAIGYVDNDRLLVADHWPALRPSGAFVSTVLDLARWEAILYADAILTESSRSAMWTPVTLEGGGVGPYGFGWQISDQGRRLVFHFGGMPGFRAGYARYVNEGLTIIFLANLDDIDPYAILVGVANLHLP
jgi:CubicO group peptidase (beta-lactamase class C family)